MKFLENGSRPQPPTSHSWSVNNGKQIQSTYSPFRRRQDSKFTSLFKWAVWKETCDDHSGVRLAFRRAVRVSSPPSTPYSISTMYTLFHLQWHVSRLFAKLEAKARRSLLTQVWQKRRTSFSLKCHKRDVGALASSLAASLASSFSSSFGRCHWTWNRLFLWCI